MKTFISLVLLLICSAGLFLSSCSPGEPADSPVDLATDPATDPVADPAADPVADLPEVRYYVISDI
ncbi:MAG: hypothetical protein ACI835_003742 [Planctomycetota bacterium]|jgi:hypothetical protein